MTTTFYVVYEVQEWSSILFHWHSSYLFVRLREFLNQVFTITVQRDTDGDGNPDVTDTDDDNDGATDEEEAESGTDPKDDTDVPDETLPDTIAPVITPIEEIDVVENEPIDDIVVDVNEPSDVVVDGLPNGLEYDPKTGTISGTPVINNWGSDETEREFVVTIIAEDEAGNSSSLEFVLVVQRDKDEDGNPNVTDPDDDNDRATDEEITLERRNSFSIIDSTGEESKNYNLSFEEFFSSDYIKKHKMEYKIKDQDSSMLNWFYSQKFSAFPRSEEARKITTPKILMTEAVFLNYKEIDSDKEEFKKRWWNKQDASLYQGHTIYGGSLIYTTFKP